MSEQVSAAIILAAGKGTRMKSDLPKVLHPVAGQPMIALLLDTVTRVGTVHNVLVLGPDMEEVATAMKASGVAAKTVIQDPQLGTGHAVLAAREAFEDFSGHVLVLYGDTPLLTSATLRAMLEVLDPENGADPPALVALAFVPEDPAEYGRMVLGEDGALEAIIEARDASAEILKINLCAAGVFAADAEVLFDLLDAVEDDNAKREYYLTDIVAIARSRGLFCAVVEGDELEVMGVNSRAQLARAEAVVQDRLRDAALDRGVTFIDPATVYLSHDTKFGRDVTIEPNVFFGPGVTIANNVRIRAFSHIEGATIRKGATVGPFARLRPQADIGPGARVGNFVEVKKATLEAGAKVNHLAYIGDARVGANANIGAGTITCNYDGFSKSFTDIGAGAFIGSNTALVAPVSIGSGAIVGAGSVIVSDVSKDAIAVGRGEQKMYEGAAARYRAKRQRGGD